MDDLVDKIESKRYDSALYDALRALVTVFGDTDSVVCQAESNEGGALNIYLSRQKNNQLFKKVQTSKQYSVKSGQKGSHQTASKGQSSGNSDIALVSPIGKTETNNVNSNGRGKFFNSSASTEEI